LTLVLFSSGAATVFYFAHLETVPISGRTRFNIFSEESVRKVGEMEYRLLLDELREKGVRVLPPWDWRVIKVKKVMERLLPFSGVRDKWGEQWEVVVVDDDRTANAFVLPGGKVFVFSGILRLAGSDAGLATVLGHEIAHNLAGHHAERMSQDFGAVVVLGSLVLLGGVIGIGPFLIGWFGTGFWKGLLDVVFGLPMSRLQESEADYIGLMMMAEACYDPREAVKFWARMEMATGGDVVPEVMSTHPTVGFLRSLVGISNTC
jgi:Zn-dependent protease with chaperone function